MTVTHHDTTVGDTVCRQCRVHKAPGACWNCAVPAPRASASEAGALLPRLAEVFAAAIAHDQDAL